MSDIRDSAAEPVAWGEAIPALSNSRMFASFIGPGTNASVSRAKVRR